MPFLSRPHGKISPWGALLLLGQLPSPVVIKPELYLPHLLGWVGWGGGEVGGGGGVKKNKLQGVPQWVCIKKMHEREGEGEGPGAVTLKGEKDPAHEGPMTGTPGGIGEGSLCSGRA
jgi:hypothetical protein